MPGVVSGVSSEGGGVVWLLVPPSRSIYPFRPCGFVRFPRIGLKPGNVRRFCQLVSPHSLRSSSLVCSSRPSSRRLVSCGVSSLFFAVHPSSRLVHQFAGGSLRRLVRRSGSPSCSLFLGVSPCPVHRFSSRVPVSSARLVKQSVFSRFAWRLVSAVRGVGSGSLCLPSHPLLFSYHLTRCRFMAMGMGSGSSFAVSYRCGVFPSRCPVVESDWVMTVGMEMGVPFDDTRDAPFYSARFPHRGDDGAIWNRAAGEENAMRRYGAI